MKPTGYRVVFQRIQQGEDIRVVKQGLADAENVKWRSCNNVFVLKRLAGMPPEGVDKAVKRYEGGKEISFSARTGKVLVKVIGAKTKDAAATIELSFWAHLELVQEAGKDGIIVRLPSNSIMPDWEIHDESVG